MKLGKKKVQEGFFVSIMYSKEIKCWSSWRVFCFCAHMFDKVKKNLSVKARESKLGSLRGKFRGNLGERFKSLIIDSVSSLLLLVFMLVVSFMFVIRGKLELNFFLMLFAMVSQHSSLLTTCSSCSSLSSVLFYGHALALLLFMVMFNFIITIGCDFIHLYCCLWSCSHSFLLLFNMVMFLFYLYNCSFLLLFMVMLSLISTLIHGHALIHLCYC